MPHQLFEIDELLRLVIDELVETNPRTAVSFALTCRSFEEPTLSSLWKKQESLTGLMKVLPGCTWVRDEYGFDIFTIGHDPSARDWARLQRYAFWMRCLDLGSFEIPNSDTLSRLSSGGVLLPKLEWLRWEVHETPVPLPFFHLLPFSNLKNVTLYTYPPSYPISPGQLTTLVRVVSFLPTSLEVLSITCGQEKGDNLKDAISSFACRCGSSLMSFGTSLPLSEAAIHHLIQLPNLSSWKVVQRPPRVVSTPIFPPLEELYLEDPETLPWLHLLASRGSAEPRTKLIRETLKCLHCPWSTIIDSALLSSIVNFRNLAVLCVQTHCSGEGGCDFHLTDDDMKNLASTLSRLKSLELGRPCLHDSCKTTVASLVSISIHCLDLTVLEVHFNAKTIVSDIQRLLGGGAGLHEAKCKLQSLYVGLSSLDICEEDIEPVAMGLRVIFPHLTNLWGSNGPWDRVRFKLGV